MMKKVLNILKNKYFLITTIFVVWILFFDKSNLISQVDLAKKLRQLKEDKKYFQTEIRSDSIKTYNLLNDPENLEKFSRERYRAKRDSEDIFLIVPKDSIKDSEE